MPETATVSIDEFMESRKAFAKGDMVLKASRAPSTWDKDKRSGRFVMSAEVEDRDRDIIIQEGLDITEFLKNPIAPFAHRSSDFPIGGWANVQKVLTGRPKRTEGDLELVPEGTDGVADRLAFHIGAGSIKACSIGFIPRAVERRPVPEDKKDSYFYPGYKILEAELVECSPVAIPSNPAALAKSAEAGDKIALGILEEVLDQWARHPETGLIIPRAEFDAAYKAATGNRTTITMADLPPELKGVVERVKHLPEPPAAPKSIARRLLDSIFGEENAAKLETEARAQNIAIEPNGDEVIAALGKIKDLADRRAAVAKREADLRARLEAKGLVA